MKNDGQGKSNEEGKLRQRRSSLLWKQKKEAAIHPEGSKNKAKNE